MEIGRLLDFLKTAEQLKCNTRHSYTSSGRLESVAEHSWRLALMAMLVGDEFPELDLDKVIKMCLIHDMGEAITGDIPAFEKTDKDRKVENKKVEQLTDILPEPVRAEWKALFEEMEAMETQEARLYKSLDKLEALIHHNEAVAVADGVGHVVRDHQRGQLAVADDLVRDLQDLCRRRGVERSGVLVEQEQLRRLKRRHQQRQCLPLAAGEQTDLCSHPVFESETERRQLVAEELPLRLRHAPAERPLFAAAIGQREVFFDLHVRRRAHHGVLEHAADVLRALVFRHGRHIHAANFNRALVHGPHARDSIQQRGLASAVATDDRDEIAVGQL